MKTRTCASQIEALEYRKLMSATAAVLDGTLQITGTPNRDAVIVELHHGDATKLDVRLNGKLSTFNIADFTGVTIDTLGGNDLVQVSEKNGKIYLPFIVDGGDGNDSITTASGNDVIDGGAGNDMVSAGAGDDQINGDAGNDKLIGGTDNDIIDAGAGRDVVNGGAGANNLDGGAGKDTIQVAQGTNSVAADPSNPHEVTGNTGDKKIDVYQVSSFDQMSAALTDLAAQAVPGATVYRVEQSGDNYTLCYHFGTDPTSYRVVVSVDSDTGDVELVSREVSLQEARPAAIAAFATLHPNTGLVSLYQLPHSNYTVRYRDADGNIQQAQTTEMIWGVDDAAEDANGDGYSDRSQYDKDYVPGAEGNKGDDQNGQNNNTRSTDPNSQMNGGNNNNQGGVTH